MRTNRSIRLTFPRLALLAACVPLAPPAAAQLTDVQQTPNTLDAGIRKSLVEQIGPGRGDAFTPGSSTYLIARDPFRAVVRGRQLFQRKFTLAQGHGPRSGDGLGNIELQAALGAGLADSCAACHGRPFGAAGVGGTVFTRPDGRDAPHLFGLGLVEMLADEITTELRAQHASALRAASTTGRPVTLELESKGLRYGQLTAFPDGSVDTGLVTGVDPDLRVRPFFAQGSTVSIREFVVGALNAEMGLQAADPDLQAASEGQDVTTPAGMRLTGTQDAIEAPPAAHAGADPDGDGVVDEVPVSLVDALEFYLLNYFRPGQGPATPGAAAGRRRFEQVGCAQCHVPDLELSRDRRVADVRTDHDPASANGVFNQLFATAVPLHGLLDDGSGLPALKPPLGAPFQVQGIYADFKRHDLGQAFHERNFDGSVTTQFLTEPLWGVASTAPYGHDGRSATLTDVILRHGGEAQAARDRFAALADDERGELLEFLSRLVLFSPPDTASNLDPVRPDDPRFPLYGHGSIDLSVLFNDPTDKE